MTPDHTLYFQYNPWWEDPNYNKAFITRPTIQAKLETLLDDKAIIFLTGLRRVGKTTLMKVLIQKLLEKEIPAKQIFYISLDDYLLKDISILDIIAEYRKIHKLPSTTKVYAFLDEITYKEDFRLQLKNLYDNDNTKIFTSASSSSAFRDRKGLLTGRERVIEIPPLNFEEFLHFKNIQIKQRDAFLRQAYFEEYLQIGGLPEYVLNQDREYLTALVEDILYKDIIGFHGLKHPNLIKDYFSLLMERAGKQISINKIAKILNISPDTARRYLNLFEETYLIYLMPRFGKTNETILSAKKIYAADLGIRNLFTGFRDKGAVFENLVYLAIKSLHPRYIYQNGLEIDFFTESKILIEAKYGKEIEAKQLQLFNEIKAKKKLIIKNLDDLRMLEELTT